MKSLGKQNVYTHTYLNGEFKHMNMSFQTVYEKADGTYWINDLGSKVKVELAKDNSDKRRPSANCYKRDFHMKEVRAYTGSDIFDMIKVRINQGVKE